MGMGLTCGLYPLGFSIEPGMANRAPLGFGPWMLIGILPFFFGVSLLIIYYVNKREDMRYEADEMDPIPPHKVNGE